jgi:hypothetical protein
MENKNIWQVLKLRNRFFPGMKVHFAEEGHRTTVCGRSLSLISSKSLIEKRAAISHVSALKTRDDMADNEKQICVKCGKIVSEILGRSIGKSILGIEVLLWAGLEDATAEDGRKVFNIIENRIQRPVDSESLKRNVLNRIE